MHKQNLQLQCIKEKRIEGRISDNTRCSKCEFQERTKNKDQEQHEKRGIAWKGIINLIQDKK